MFVSKRNTCIFAAAFAAIVLSAAAATAASLSHPAGSVARHVASGEEAAPPVIILASNKGTGEGEGEGEGAAEGEGEGEVLSPFHSGDQNHDLRIDYHEFSRLQQFYLLDGYHCAPSGVTTEDGFLPEPGDYLACAPNEFDFDPRNGVIGLSEYLRGYEFLDAWRYFRCVDSPDGFCLVGIDAHGGLQPVTLTEGGTDSSAYLRLFSVPTADVNFHFLPDPALGPLPDIDFSPDTPEHLYSFIPLRALQNDTVGPNPTVFLHADSCSTDPDYGNRAFTLAVTILDDDAPEGEGTTSEGEGEGEGSPEGQAPGDAPEYATLTLSAIGTGEVFPCLGQHVYPVGSLVAVQATDTNAPTEAFSRWDGDVGDGVDHLAPGIVVTMDQDREIAAIFGQHDLVHVSITGEGSTSPAPRALGYPVDAGNFFGIVAENAPNSGDTFCRWLGDIGNLAIPTDPSIGFAPGSGDSYITAVFTADCASVHDPDRAVLTTSVNGNATVSPSPGPHVYQYGALATLSVSSIANGYGFLRWEGDIGVGTKDDANPLKLTMKRDRTINAVVAPLRTLTLNVAGLACDGFLAPYERGSSSVLEGDTVSITAVPSDAQVFDGWIGNPDSGDLAQPTLSFIMPAHDVDLTASFTPPDHYDRSLFHSADLDHDGSIGLEDYLRVNELYAGLHFRCAINRCTDDGYETGIGDFQGCRPYDADYAPRDGSISLDEILRVTQLYYLGYDPCDTGPDGFCVRTLDDSRVAPVHIVEGGTATVEFALREIPAEPISLAATVQGSVSITNPGPIFPADETALSFHEVQFKAAQNSVTGPNSPVVVDITFYKGQDTGVAVYPLAVYVEDDDEETGTLSADQNGDHVLSLDELLRVIQFYNLLGYHCAPEGTTTEDGYVAGPGDHTTCNAHDSDRAPQDWAFSLAELLRLIQFYNSRAYHYCPGTGSEDDFCTGP